MKKTLSAILLICAVWAGYTYFVPHGQKVEVISDGRRIRVLDLAREPQGMIEIRSKLGYNILQIENGTIRVAEADCPNHDCIKMGILRAANLPIVCLPHRMTVRFISGNTVLDSISQ